MPRSALPFALVLGLLVAITGATPAAATDGVPQPCFVPPHPAKGAGAPALDAASSPRGIGHPGPLGGGALPYHDDHLAEGVLPAAEETFPRLFDIAVLLVDFDDREMGTFFEDSVTDSTYLYLNRVMENLRQMYWEMSDGQVELTWQFTPQVYRLPEPMAWYGLDDSIATREAELCRDAVEAADADVDFSQFNTFMMFHAGEGQEGDIYDDSREAIWSVFFRQVDFEYWLDAPDSEHGIRTADTGPGGETFYVEHMVVLPEYQSQDGFVFGMQGVVSHEFGHRFGLPDLYDTTGPADFIYADSQGIGTFGLMGSGIWNGDGFWPAEMSAWSRFYVGWLRPPVLRADREGGEREVALAAIQHARRDGAVRIPLGGDEYFLIENRIRDYNGNGIFDFGDGNDDSLYSFWEDTYVGAEYDWYLPQFLSGERPADDADGSGLLIWHVDESVISEYLLYNMVNADALHKGVDLEEADGIQDLDKLIFAFEAFGDPRDSFWAPNAVEFTPETEPSSLGYHGAQSDLWITDISAAGDTMTFKVRFDSGGTGAFKDGWPRDLPGLVRDFQPVVGDLDGDGLPEIVQGVVDEQGQGGPVLLRSDGSSFLPAAEEPTLLSRGTLRAEPIMADLDPERGGLELVWVSADTIYAMTGHGVYLGADGGVSDLPVPFYVLDEDPGRVRLTAGDMDFRWGDGRPEILVGAPYGAQPGSWDALVIAYEPGEGTQLRTAATYADGTTRLPHTLFDADTIDGGLKEVVSSVRTEEGGYLSVALLWEVPNEYGFYHPGAVWRFSLGDTVAFSAPVAGDIDGDGIEEIVVADSEGWVHALALKIGTNDGMTKNLNRGGTRGLTAADTDPPGFDNHRYAYLPGWPVEVGTLADDALSLADVDGDGRLEVLVFGPQNWIYAFNYNGTAVVSMPVPVPGEDRFTAPFLSPLALDLTGDGAPNLLLPLSDGQVRGHDPLGRALDGWSYLGGGNQGTYPAVLDLDDDGRLDLVTVEDVSVAFPEGIHDGDEAGTIGKTGRILVRDVGVGGGGPWPAYRHDPGRSGRAPAPAREGSEPASGLVSDTFVMPNPVVGGDAGIHYLVRSDVELVTIEIYDATGRKITTLDGSVYGSTDNLIHWDLTNSQGNPVAPGLFFARLQAEAGGGMEVTLVRFVVVR